MAVSINRVDLIELVEAAECMADVFSWGDEDPDLPDHALERLRASIETAKSILDTTQPQQIPLLRAS